MHKLRELFTRRLGTGALLVALCLPSPSVHAKLGVPYGEDGGPKDSDTQAKVDALNDALDGPDEGQSQESWEAEFKAAHDALYGDLSTSASTTNGNGNGSAGSGSNVPQNDMCQSPLDEWLQPASSELVADALSESSVRTDLTKELENFILYQMRLETAGTIATVGRPNISHLSCAHGDSEITATIPITLVELGWSIDHGSITLHASASYRDRPELADWCVDVDDYDIVGFEPITLAMIKPRITEAMGDNPFCMPAFGRAYAVTHK